MKKKQKKIKNVNQASFYFEDYLETNKKNKFFYPYKLINKFKRYLDLEAIDV